VINNDRYAATIADHLSFVTESSIYPKLQACKTDEL
jgi:hypothetical protein